MISKIMRYSLTFALFAFAMPTAIQAQSSAGGSGDGEAPSNATLQRECDGGLFSSCGMLGQRLQYDGNASSVDMKKGFALFKRACDGGDTISCGDLAQSYLFGKGVAVDERRAAQLSERTCNDGNMIGCSLLGIIHQEGHAGYPKNPAKALSYYRKACNESQPRWEFPCKRADALAGVAPPPVRAAPVVASIQAPVYAASSRIGQFDFDKPVQTTSLNGLIWKEWLIPNATGPSRTFFSIIDQRNGKFTYILVYYITGNVVSLSVNSVDCKLRMSKFIYFGGMQSLSNYRFTKSENDKSKPVDPNTYSVICSRKNFETVKITIP